MDHVAGSGNIIYPGYMSYIYFYIASFFLLSVFDVYLFFLIIMKNHGLLSARRGEPITHVGLFY